MRSNLWRFLALLLSLSLVAAACSGDDDDDVQATDDPSAQVDPEPDGPDGPDPDDPRDDCSADPELDGCINPNLDDPEFPGGDADQELELDLLATGLLIAGGGSEETIDFDVPADDAISVMTSWLGDADEISDVNESVGAGCPSDWYTYRWADLELLFLVGFDGAEDTFAEWVLDSRHSSELRFGWLRDRVAVGEPISAFRDAFPEWDGSVVALFEGDPDGPGWFGFDATLEDYETSDAQLSGITTAQADDATVDLFWAGNECSHFVS